MGQPMCWLANPMCVEVGLKTTCKSWLSHQVTPKNQNEVIRLGSKYFYPWNHLIVPRFTFLEKNMYTNFCMDFLVFTGNTANAQQVPTASIRQLTTPWAPLPFSHSHMHLHVHITKVKRKPGVGEVPPL